MTGKSGKSEASRLIDERIAAPGDRRGEMPARVRALIREAVVPNVSKRPGSG